MRTISQASDPGGKLAIADNSEEARSLVLNGSKDGLVKGGDSGAAASVAIWKTLAFIFFGLTILFATDVFELHGDYSGSTPTSGQATIHFKNNGTNGDGTESPPTEPAAASDVVPPPTEAPKADVPEPPPTQPSPTEAPPTDAPKAEPAPQTTPAATSSPGAATSLDPIPYGLPGPRFTYRRRGQPMEDSERQEMEKKWGTWTLKDDKDRPKNDIYAKFNNRDIPRNKFPNNAWQTDKDYLEKFLKEGLDLVERAQNAILEEYGQPKDSTSEMFDIGKLDTWEGIGKVPPCSLKGGCTDTSSWDNLVRRLLHAVMTEDQFVVAMAGHSASAAHGNHFTQSYTLQVQWILEAVFARLGVKHAARNMGMGGLGTVQAGLATKSLIGYDLDILLWDSGMTEKEGEARDVLFRQAILGPGKVPMLGTLDSRYGEIALLHKEAGADGYMVGSMESGMKPSETLDEVKNLPWAAQYVRCGNELKQICRNNEYSGKCWIQRADVRPTVSQRGVMMGRASWHPGNRIHQVKGRSIAFFILSALKEALTIWKDAENYELNDEVWHVTSMYNSQRDGVANLGDDVGECKKYGAKEHFTSIMCKTAMKARTEFTPRAYPDQSMIRTLMPKDMLKELNDPPAVLYQPPEVFNPNIHPPKGAVDVLNIVEAGIDYADALFPDYYTKFFPKPKFKTASTQPFGKGHELVTSSGFCDGSVDSWCKKQDDNDCLLYGHNDGRHGIVFNSYSGWMVLNIPDTKLAYIGIKFETWHAKDTNTRTKGWTSIDNARRLRTGSSEEDVDLVSSSAYHSQNTSEAFETDAFFVDDDEEGHEYEQAQYHRELKPPVPEYCDQFKFEWSLDGKVTKWNKDQFLNHHAPVERVVEVVTLVEDKKKLNDPEKEVELAYRMTGCGTDKTMKITHLYWI